MNVSRRFFIGRVVAFGAFAGWLGFGTAAEWPMVRQTVATEWPDAASAAAAQAEVMMLGEGETFVFSGRWDDRNPRSLAVAKALSPLGFRSTFYTNGRSDPKYAQLLRDLVALGNSIGCHTIKHDFMCRLLPTKSFRGAAMGSCLIGF